MYLQGIFVSAILFLLLFHGYKKFIAPYTVFGSCWPPLILLRSFITGPYHKDIPLSCYSFQLFVEQCKKNMPDGIGVIWMPNPQIIIFNEEGVKTLSNSQAALNKGKIYHLLENDLGSGILTSNAELWRKRRKMLQPAFQVSMLKKHVPTFNKNSAILVQRLLTMADEPIRIIHPLKKCTFDNLLENVFGMDFNNPSGKEKEKKIVQVVKCLTGITKKRILNPLLQPRFMLPLFSTGREFLKATKEGKDVTEEILLRLKDAIITKNAENKTNAEDVESYGKFRKSFAEILVHAQLKDPSFTMQDMHDEITTIMMTGFDSVAHTLMWCLFLLGNHQEVQEQVYNEVKHLMGSDISYEDVQSMTYTECVIKESLRLYPIAPLYSRFLEEDIQIGKYNIPKDTNIVFFSYLLHRNPEVYPNPEKFDPERFNSGTDKNPWSFTPFSEGIRSCIGMKYAMLQMKITLAYILQSFKLTSLQRVEDIVVGWEFILVPSQPILLRFTPRHHTTQES